MKFIEGRTLQAAIDEFHARDEAQHGEREVERRRLLECFLDLCDAVAYAHSRGVIHRDIKPDNVMLGSFGETLVVDWGLAKVVDQPDIPGLSGMSVAITSSGRSAETQAGSVVGTPAYMPPELAEGHAADADATCDVYLLGATLYYILTGRAPRSGSSRDEMVELARTVPPVAPRQLKRDVARPLEAICLKAMARKPSARYATAREVGEEVRRYLAGEPAKAYPEPLAARAWRRVKRHRRAVIRSLTAAALLGLIAFSAAMVSRVRWHEALELADRQVKDFRRDANEALFLASSSDAPAEPFRYFDLSRAAEAVERALAATRSWGPTLENLPLADQRDKLRIELYELLLLAAQLKLHQADGTRNESAVAGGSADGTPGAPGALDEARTYLVSASTLATPTQGYYRLQAQRLRLLGETAPADESEQRGQDPSTPATALDHFLRGEQLRMSPASLLKLDDPVEPTQRRRNLERAIAEYAAALQSDPQHFWSLLQLGRCRLASGDPRQVVEGVANLGTCVSLRPDLPWGYSSRGVGLAMLGRYSDALADLNRALDKDPEFLPAKLHRGWVYWRQGAMDKAVQDLLEVWNLPEDRRLAPAAYYLGQINLANGKYDEAASYLSSFAALDTSLRPAFHHLAQAEYLRGNAAGGRQALNRFLELGADSPFDADSPAAHVQRGEFLTRLATNSAARRKLLPLALAEFAKVGAANRSTDYYYYHSLALEESKRLGEALSALSEGLKIEPLHLGLLNRRGWIYFLQGKHDQAEQDYARTAGQKPQQDKDRALIAEAHAWLGCLRAAKQDPRSTEDVIRAMLVLRELKPTRYDHVVWHNLACVLGKLSEEQPEGREAQQTLAIELLAVALRSARLAGRLPLELRKIEGEEYFGPLLKARPEFQQLLRDSARSPAQADDVAPLEL
jgi:tetratricopeptide (TPR) repeat protein